MNYFKNKKTKFTKILLDAQDLQSEYDIELALYKDGDLDGFSIAEWYTGDYIDLERLNKQVHKLVKQGYECIELRYPDGMCFCQTTIYKK